MQVPLCMIMRISECIITATSLRMGFDFKAVQPIVRSLPAYRPCNVVLCSAVQLTGQLNKYGDVSSNMLKVIHWLPIHQCIEYSRDAQPAARRPDPAPERVISGPRSRLINTRRVAILVWRCHHLTVPSNHKRI